MAIIITGSVGTGKTTLAKKLSKKINYGYIDVNKLIKDNGLSSGYDDERKCDIVDINKLNKFLINLIKKNKEIIIDSHMSHFLSKEFVELCIVTKCDLNELNKRLKKRGYTKGKIKDNLECEVFETCLTESQEQGHNILVINTTKGLNMVNLLQNIGEKHGIKPTGKGTKRNNTKFK